MILNKHIQTIHKIITDLQDYSVRAQKLQKFEETQLALKAQEPPELPVQITDVKITRKTDMGSSKKLDNSMLEENDKNSKMRSKSRIHYLNNEYSDSILEDRFRAQSIQRLVLETQRIASKKFDIKGMFYSLFKILYPTPIRYFWTTEGIKAKITQKAQRNKAVNSELSDKNPESAELR